MVIWKPLLLMMFLYSTLATGRLIPTTTTKTFNSMHRMADFAFIPPSLDSAGNTDEVRVLLLRAVVFLFSVIRLTLPVVVILDYSCYSCYSCLSYYPTTKYLRPSSFFFHYVLGHTLIFCTHTNNLLFFVFDLLVFSYYSQNSICGRA